MIIELRKYMNTWPTCHKDTNAKAKHLQESISSLKKQANAKGNLAFAFIIFVVLLLPFFLAYLFCYIFIFFIVIHIIFLIFIYIFFLSHLQFYSIYQVNYISFYLISPFTQILI